MKQITNKMWIGDHDDLVTQSKLYDWVIVYVGSDDKFKEREHPRRSNLYMMPLVDDSIKQEDKITEIICELLVIYEDVYDNNKILICCDSGLSRSPYMVARWISYRLKCDMNTAYNMLKSVYKQADEETPLRCNDR